MTLEIVCRAVACRSKNLCVDVIIAGTLEAKVSLLKLLGHECFATKEAAAAGIALHFKGGGQAPPSICVDVQCMIKSGSCQNQSNMSSSQAVSHRPPAG